MKADAGQSFAEATDLSGRLIGATNFVLDFWWLWTLAALGAWVAFRLRDQHALLAKLDERADAAFGDIDALLAERQALIGNLVRVVRGFASHERELINDVLEARVAALEAVGQGAGVNIEAQVAASLKNLFTVAETYPDLASESHFRSLRGDLVRIEERITAARKFYNLAVEEANSVGRAFPGNLLRGRTPAREKFTLGESRAALAQPIAIDL